MGNKINRFFKRTLSPRIGFFCSLVYVKAALISIILLIIQLNQQGESLVDAGFGTVLLSYIINIVFYLIVANLFRKGKEEFGYAYHAMFLLTLSMYIIPFIIDLLDWFVVGLSGVGTTVWIMLLVSIILGALLGIIYYVLMTKEVKNSKRSYHVGMLIIGILMTLIALYSLIINIYDLSTSFETSVLGIITLVVNIYSEVILFLFSFLYLLYAYDVYRIRNGYIY